MSEDGRGPDEDELLAGLDRLPTPPDEPAGGKLPVRWTEEEGQLLERISHERGDKVKELLRGLVRKALEDARQALDDTGAAGREDAPEDG